MLKDLKEILERGIKDVAKEEASHADRAILLRGKSEGFSEVLAVIEQLEGKARGSEDTAAEKEEG